MDPYQQILNAILNNPVGTYEKPSDIKYNIVMKDFIIDKIVSVAHQSGCISFKIYGRQTNSTLVTIFSQFNISSMPSCCGMGIISSFFNWKNAGDIIHPLLFEYFQKKKWKTAIATLQRDDTNRLTEFKKHGWKELLEFKSLSTGRDLILLSVDTVSPIVPALDVC